MVISKKNLGTLDRVIRFVLAIGMLVLYVFGFIGINDGNFMLGAFFWVVAAMGGIFLITSALSFCPVYSLLGLSTCDMKEAV